MTPWLTAAFRALVVLVLGCAVLVVVGLTGNGPIDLTLLAIGVPTELFGTGTVALVVAGVIVAAQAFALVAATRRREWGRWALLAIAVGTAAARVSTGSATGELLAAVVYSAIWLLLAGILFLPTSTDWFETPKDER